MGFAIWHHVNVIGRIRAIPALNKRMLRRRRRFARRVVLELVSLF